MLGKRHLSLNGHPSSPTSSGGNSTCGLWCQSPEFQSQLCDVLPWKLIQVTSFLSTPGSCSFEWKRRRSVFKSVASCGASLPVSAAWVSGEGRRPPRRPVQGAPLQAVRRPECMFEFKTAEFTWLPGISLPLSSSHRMPLVTSAAHSEPVSPVQCAQPSLLTRVAVRVRVEILYVEESSRVHGALCTQGGRPSP